MGFFDKLLDIFNGDTQRSERTIPVRTGEEEFLDYNMISAHDIFQKRVSEGDGRAAYFLGLIHEGGYGVVKPDVEAAKRFLQFGANAGDVLCMIHLPVLLSAKAGMPISNIDTMKPQLDTMAQSGDVFAMNELAGLLNAVGEEGTSWNIKAAEAGYWKAMLELAQYYWENRDYSTSFEYAEMAVNRGAALAMRHLAQCYITGNGVKRNIKKAVQTLIDLNRSEPDVAIKCEIANLYDIQGDAERSERYYREVASTLFKKHTLQAEENYYAGIICERGIGRSIDFDLAFQYYDESAKQGYSEAKYKVGLFMLKGRGVEKNVERAVEWFREATKAGSLSAQCQLGICYQDGIGVEKDYNKSVELFKMSAEKYNRDGQFLYGMCYWKGYGVEKNEETALLWINRAVNQGCADAELFLANIKKNDDNKKEYYRLIELSAKHGNPHAQYTLGLLYATIEIPRPKHYKYIEWFKKAAAQGNAEAEYELGAYYLSDWNDDKDEEQGIWWLNNAAKHGNIDAAHLLGSTYATSNLVPRNYEKALMWWEKAAQEGNSSAQYSLGEAYEQGNGVPHDDVMAFKYYKMAADNYNENAIYRMAKMLYEGRGTAKDEFKALQLIKQAAKLGCKEADLEIKNLYNKDKEVREEKKMLDSSKLDKIASNIKQLHEQTSELFRTLENVYEQIKMLGMDLPADKKPVDIFQTDILNYMFYLASADGPVSWDACYVIGRCYGKVNVSPTWVNTEILSTFDREKFASSAPPSLYFCILCDSLMAERNSGSYSSKCADTLITTFSQIGEQMVLLDEKITGNEFRNHNAYIDRMQNHVKEQIAKYSKNQNSGTPNGSGQGLASERQQQKFASVTSSKPEDDTSLDELINELNNLIGLTGVKAEVNSLINLINNRKRREKMGLKSKPMSMHLVFTGNPGTGKTTVARLLGKIYFHLGILSKGHFIETQRSGLVGGYVGQTALKVQEVIQQALGGILFIDEAYSLADKGDNDYGKEAIDTLLKEMEDHRDDLVVIAAGYPQEMDKFLQSNPGLPSRFNKKIFFEDYSPDELTEIFLLNCRQEDYQVDAFTTSYVRNLFTEQYGKRDKFFGNGRYVRNFYEKVMSIQVDRLEELGDNATKDELMRITIDDVKKVDMATIH